MIYSVLRYGGVAQLVERLLCKQKVSGSTPLTSTIMHFAIGAVVFNGCVVVPWHEMWPLRLVVRTPPFHGGDTGSSPVGVTIFPDFSTIFWGALSVSIAYVSWPGFSICGDGAGSSGSLSGRASDF
jgi:hypothetical protein